jgi:hypothetical protein
VLGENLVDRLGSLSFWRTRRSGCPFRVSSDFRRTRWGGVFRISSASGQGQLGFRRPSCDANHRHSLPYHVLISLGANVPRLPLDVAVLRASGVRPILASRSLRSLK